MGLELTEQQKVDVLITVYVESRKEISFWRDRSWLAMTWTVATLMAIGAASVLNPGTRWMLLPTVALAIAAGVYLIKNQRTYRDRWRRLSEVENALGFFEPGTYVDGRSLLPSDLAVPSITVVGSGAFVFIVGIVAGGVGVAIWFA